MEMHLQPLATAFVGHILIYTSRTVARLWSGVLGQIDRHRHVRIFECQVRGLVLVVIGVGDKYRRQPVKADFAVGFGVNNGRALRCGL
jgi:hypothetical protein